MTSDNASENNTSEVGQEELWYLNNYVLIRDYYDRTISRIAARCVRKGNIAIEDYPFYSYILDVLEEISEVGDYLLKNKKLYPHIEKKIIGGVEGLRKNLKEYKNELTHNSTPDMIKEDEKDMERMKNLLGGIDSPTGFDPTKGAGMNMDELMNKLMNKDSEEKAEAGREAKREAEGEREVEFRKIVKVKKPINTATEQAVPEKDMTEE